MSILKEQETGTLRELCGKKTPRLWNFFWDKTVQICWPSLRVDSKNTTTTHTRTDVAETSEESTGHTKQCSSAMATASVEAKESAPESSPMSNESAVAWVVHLVLKSYLIQLSFWFWNYLNKTLADSGKIDNFDLNWILVMCKLPFTNKESNGFFKLRVQNIVNNMTVIDLKKQKMVLEKRRPALRENAAFSHRVNEPWFSS